MSGCIAVPRGGAGNDGTEGGGEKWKKRYTDEEGDKGGREKPTGADSSKGGGGGGGSKCHYDVLKVGKKAGKKEIDKAYRRRCIEVRLNESLTHSPTLASEM